MAFSDLNWDWTTQRPSKEDSTILFCVPALSPVQFTDLGCWFEADENVASGCKSIAGNYVLLITPQGDLKTQLFIVSKADSIVIKLQSKHYDIVPLECVVYNAQAQTSSNPKIEHLRALAQNKDGNWVMVTSREIVSRRELAHDLVEKEFQQAFILETGTRDAGWYRYADAVFNIGRHPKSEPFQNNWLVLRSAQ